MKVLSTSNSDECHRDGFKGAAPSGEFGIILIIRHPQNSLEALASLAPIF